MAGFVVWSLREADTYAEGEQEEASTTCDRARAASIPPAPVAAETAAQGRGALERDRAAAPL